MAALGQDLPFAQTAGMSTTGRLFKFRVTFACRTFVALSDFAVLEFRLALKLLDLFLV